ncbi:phosphatase PAP2 family protein [Streptomyces sp. HNM0663]|uniref:Phosphatase PAP2 family protein n=1 Tax=Streptomyces chengmaiensis TaxID=3040919 RepID=A0ABT6HP98_9ACTN|nr:phosphatase PAP2 family protein [Streptomyces chengmaiensis]MDH2390533.1 phosphatase PAP2 family protein [Streptomyces chengmaiensis]
MPDTATVPDTATAGRRPRWQPELLLIAVVYAAYSGGRLLARGDVTTAVDHGLAILRAEKALALDLEHPLNRLFSSTPALGIPADFVYASLHYLVTPAVLIWLFRRRPARYRAARAWLMISTLLGLVGFTLVPTCPPRLLDAAHGFVDTMAQFSSYGWWGGEASAPRGLGGMTNQYAAMPSLHVGWALWCGAVLWRHGRTAPTKAFAVGYPLLTAVVVMGTANHYFLDAVAGAAVMGVGALLTRPAMRLLDRVSAVLPREANSRAVSDGCKTSAGERIPGQRTSSAASAEAECTADPKTAVGAGSVSAAADAGGGADDSAPAATR